MISNDGMTSVVSKYFKSLFESSNTQDIEEALEDINHVVSSDMNLMWNKEPTGEEVRNDLFQMHPNKASGTDGMHAFSFRNFGTLWVGIVWHMCKVSGREM